jgi:hypothetical protein
MLSWRPGSHQLPNRSPCLDNRLVSEHMGAPAQKVMERRFREKIQKRFRPQPSRQGRLVRELQAAFLSKATMKSGTAAGRTSPPDLSCRPKRTFAE